MRDHREPYVEHPYHHEVRVSCGFIDGRDKEIVHDHEKGTYTVNNVYRPDINHNCKWGK